MSTVFVSFLGIGSFKQNPGYNKAKYSWADKSARVVAAHFAQTAILKFLEDAGTPADRVVCFCTKESREKHLELFHQELRDHLDKMPGLPKQDLVPTDMNAENQWKWFEQLLSSVDAGDLLVIDFTHGMRSVPIIFSSAIGFLQRAKGVRLGHVLYGWYDQENKDQVHPIVDLRDFYVINDWAESVARLTDDADARKLAELALGPGPQALRVLADEKLIAAFEEMTDCIRNVDVNNVATKVRNALGHVEAARKKAGGSARLMLDLVWEKFSSLATEYPPSGRYDVPYFQSQLRIIEVLLEHRLFMQAFTSMREFVGSIGMAGVNGKYTKNMSNSDGRKYRRRFAEVFVNMMQRPVEEWKFYGDNERDRQTLMPWFETLLKEDVEQQLREIVKPMVDTRNGFDHAWTSKAGASDGIEADGKKYLIALQQVIEQLAEKGLLHREGEA